MISQESCAFVIKPPPTCAMDPQVLVDTQKNSLTHACNNADRSLRSPEPSVTDMLSASSNFHATTDSVRHNDGLQTCYFLILIFCVMYANLTTLVRYLSLCVVSSVSMLSPIRMCFKFARYMYTCMCTCMWDPSGELYIASTQKRTHEYVQGGMNGSRYKFAGELFQFVCVMCMHMYVWVCVNMCG